MSKRILVISTSLREKSNPKPWGTPLPPARGGGSPGGADLPAGKINRLLHGLSGLSKAPASV